MGGTTNAGSDCPDVRFVRAGVSDPHRSSAPAALSRSRIVIFPAARAAEASRFWANPDAGDELAGAAPPVNSAKKKKYLFRHLNCRTGMQVRSQLALQLCHPCDCLWSLNP